MVASVPVSGSSDGSQPEVAPEVAIENLVIVGSGPAGYTAAIYARYLSSILFQGVFNEQGLVA